MDNDGLDDKMWDNPSDEEEKKEEENRRDKEDDLQYNDA